MRRRATPFNHPLTKPYKGLKNLSKPLDILREPFDPEIVTNSDGFSNVQPIFYIKKLVDSAAEYSITRHSLTLLTFKNAAAVAVNTDITFKDGETYGDVGASAVNDSEESRELANAVMAASSTSLKRSLLSLGVGVALYEGREPTPRKTFNKSSKPAVDNDDEDDEPAVKKSASKSKKGWTGDEEIGFGAHSDEKWSEVDGAYIQFIIDKFDEGSSNRVKADNEAERRGSDFDPTECAKPKQKATSSRSGGKGRSAGRFSS